MIRESDALASTRGEATARTRGEIGANSDEMSIRVAAAANARETSLRVGAVANVDGLWTPGAVAETADESSKRDGAVAKVCEAPTRAEAKAKGSSAVSSRDLLDMQAALNAKDKAVLDLKDQISAREKQLLDLKDKNLQLGYERAFSVYKAIQKHGAELPGHVVLCTHADNTPLLDVPVLQGKAKGELTDSQRQAIKDAHAKNRRITIEDQLVNKKPPK